MDIQRTKVRDFEKIDVVTDNGGRISLLSLGATVYDWTTPSGTGIVAAYDDMEDYRHPGMYLGTTVGPNAGRIPDGTFTLGGKRYETDEKESHFLHSGKEGLSFKVFDVRRLDVEDGEAVVTFHLDYVHSVLPGRQTITVTYRIRDNRMAIDYHATSDEETIVNLTNHCYFNLNGSFDVPVNDHTLKTPASHVATADENILTDDIIHVDGTLFDFRKRRFLKEAYADPALARHPIGGVDHFFLFSEDEEKWAKLHATESDRTLTVRFTMPGLTVYTTNTPKDNTLKSGTRMIKHGAVCLEPEYNANAVNDSRFEKSTAKEGHPYRETIVYELEESQ
jgi:aldose 1-epimerase